MKTNKRRTKAGTGSKDTEKLKHTDTNDQAPVEDSNYDQEQDFGGIKAPEDFKRQLGCGG